MGHKTTVELESTRSLLSFDKDRKNMFQSLKAIHGLFCKFPAVFNRTYVQKDIS